LGDGFGWIKFKEIIKIIEVTRQPEGGQGDCAVTLLAAVLIACRLTIESTLGEKQVEA